jgi:hypothetical protein
MEDVVGLGVQASQKYFVCMVEQMKDRWGMVEVSGARFCNNCIDDLGLCPVGRSVVRVELYQGILGTLVERFLPHKARPGMPGPPCRG